MTTDATSRGLDRRRFMLAGCACLLCRGAPPGALAATPGLDPQAIQPLMQPGYAPQSADEQGLWMAVSEQEAQVKRSNFLVRDAALNSYVGGIVRDLAGPYSKDVRVYILRTPYFNASMAPNGMMQVWSGLLLRTRNEAQLAAVLGHELGHYLRQHSLAFWRDIKSKSAFASFLGLGLAVAGGGAYNSFAQLAVMASIFRYSRENEREADSYGLKLMHETGYDPRQASAVWQILLDEREETAKARGSEDRGSGDLVFATHPAPEDRMIDLARAADSLVSETGQPGGEHEARYRAALRQHRLDFLEDQVKLHDFGGSLYLLEAMGVEGWDAQLHYARGELYRQRGQDGDFASAIAAYTAAVDAPETPPAAYRGLGFALIKTGEADAGKEWLRRYLREAPDAVDRMMVQMMVQ